METIRKTLRLPRNIADALRLLAYLNDKSQNKFVTEILSGTLPTEVEVIEANKNPMSIDDQNHLNNVKKFLGIKT